MKKLLGLISLLLTIVLLVVSCGNDNAPTTTTNTPVSTTEGNVQTNTPSGTDSTTKAQDVATTTDTPVTTTAPSGPHTHSFTVEVEKVEADFFVDGYVLRKCSMCDETEKEIIKGKTEVKILAVGNSFSDDACEYLYEILMDAGFSSVKVGRLYIGGCSLDQHWNNMSQDQRKYDYYYKKTNEATGNWYKNPASVTVKTALESDDWDIVTVQQASNYSGIAPSYEYLDNVCDYINEHTSTTPKIYWHMTWAYDSNSTHSAFPSYGKDQLTMYKGIVDCVKTCVDTSDKIVGTIPCGTVVQNIRATLKDLTITRDGYHMSYDCGRYATALTWAKVLCNVDISKVTWTPYQHKDVVAPYVDTIKSCINSAVENPYCYVGSTYEELEKAVIPELKNIGRMDMFEKVDLSITNSAFYDCSKFNSTLQTKENSTSLKLNKYMASKIFNKSELPLGTVIRVDDGYQYRPEAWTDLSANISALPPMTIDQTTVVTEKWWGSYNYRAFDLSSTTGKNMTDSDANALRIYVPKG